MEPFHSTFAEFNDETVQFGESRNLTQAHAISRNLTQSHAVSRQLISQHFHAQLCHFTQTRAEDRHDETEVTSGDSRRI